MEELGGEHGYGVLKVDEDDEEFPPPSLSLFFFSAIARGNGKMKT